MNRFSVLSALKRIPARTALRAPLALALTAWLSGCYFLAADNDIKRDGSHPWWCQGGTVTLTNGNCLTQSVYADFGVALANQYWQRSDFTTAGALLDPAVAVAHPGVGQAYVLGSATTFNGMAPNVIYYDGNAPTSRPVAIGWAVDDTGGGAPAGFVGDNDVWSLVNGKYWLAMWVVRGYENHPDIFTFNHPCVVGGVGTLTATTDACFIASHTVDLEVLVTNDDGITSHGIDALVQGLKTVPGVTFNIVAPATQQSGQGGNTTPGLGIDDGGPGATLSGDTGTAVNGFPADAVLYALNFLRLSPDVTMSGINDGQNLATLGHGASGTIGAARRSLNRGFPSMALSQGAITVTPDFPAGVAASLALLEQWRLGNAGAPHMQLPNLNIPSCDGTGTITGTVETVVGVDLSSGSYFGAQNCASTKTTFVDDLDAFLNGWNSIADMGKVQPPNYP